MVKTGHLQASISEAGLPRLDRGAALRGWRTFEPASVLVYERDRDLPRLVPCWPAELAAAEASAEGHLNLIGRIRRAVRRERRNGVAGSWLYDAARHRALVEVLRREETLFRCRWRRQPLR
jgi:hypothetical protein